MNATSKALKHQEKIARKSLASSNTITDLINAPEHLPIIQPYLEKSRKRLYSPIETLGMFMTQALSPDRSCQNVVNHGALEDPKRSVSTGGYCKARQRLAGGMVKELCRNIGRQNDTQVPGTWKWEGRSVYLVDGTTFLMADTAANQEEYPQTNTLPQGIGFPDIM